jgi:hypothetical protein
MRRKNAEIGIRRIVRKRNGRKLEYMMYIIEYEEKVEAGECRGLLYGSFGIEIIQRRAIGEC